MVEKRAVALDFHARTEIGSSVRIRHVNYTFGSRQLGAREGGVTVKKDFSIAGIGERISHMIKPHADNGVAQDSAIVTGVKIESQATRNVILRGSRLVGDITVTQDIEISGNVEGNVVSDGKCDIIIRGVCRGNITSREGNVEVDGEMLGGDIRAGGSVRITGKFLGGRVEAGDRIFLNGEFSGTLLANDIELGAATRGQGELFFRDYITIQRGAHVDVRIHRAKEMGEAIGESQGKSAMDLEMSLHEKDDVIQESRP